MKKVKIKIEINDHIIKGEGTLENNILTLKGQENISYDIKNEVFIKENKELIINMNFKEKQVIYTLAEENKKFLNNLTLFSLTNSNKQVMIRYRIEGADFLLKIIYETID